MGKRLLLIVYFVGTIIYANSQSLGTGNRLIDYLLENGSSLCSQVEQKMLEQFGISADITMYFDRTDNALVHSFLCMSEEQFKNCDIGAALKSDLYMLFNTDPDDEDAEEIIISIANEFKESKTSIRYQKVYYGSDLKKHTKSVTATYTEIEKLAKKMLKRIK